MKKIKYMALGIMSIYGCFVLGQSLAMDVPPKPFKSTSQAVGDPLKEKSFPILKNVSDLQTIVRPGDWVILDIDETLLIKKEDHLINLDPKVSQLLENWQKSYPSSEKEKQIRVILLTARNDVGEMRTRNDLAEAGFPENLEIIFAPNDKTTKKKIPTKGIALVQALNASAIKPKRIFMVDDLAVNLADIQNKLENSAFSKIPLKLYLKQSDYKLYQTPLTPDEINLTFPDQLTDNLSYLQAIGGGSGGVHVLQSKSTGQKYTFKCVLDPLQMKEEMMADALYRSLGVKVPAFAVYDTVPDILQLQSVCQGPGPFRLSEFIERDQRASPEAYAKKMRDHFVADAFLSNWDIVVGNFKNVIMDQNGLLWRIDNGGSLRFRAVGSRKIESPEWKFGEVSELLSMRNASINPDGAMVYEGLTDDQLKAQAQDLLNKSPELFATLDQITAAIHLDNPSEVREMLRNRLDDLAQKFKLTIPDWKRRGVNLSPTEHPATEKAAAGILVYSRDPKTYEPVVLMGQRIGHNWWGDFGGKSDVVETDDLDKTLADTAVREVKEESRGMLSFTPMELAKVPSHQMINSQGVLYRMYLAPYIYFDVQKIKSAPEVPDYHWTIEQEDVAWVPVSALLAASQGQGEKIVEEGQETLKIKVVNRDVILYPPFLKMLQEPQIQEALVSISKGKKPAPRHTQQESTSPSRPLSLTQEKQQLAETVVKHGAVMGEMKEKLKERFPNTQEIQEDTEQVKNMKGYLSNEEAAKLRESLLKTPYTQTQGYLEFLFGKEKFLKLGGDSAKEVDTFFEEYSKFKDQMKDMEKDHPDYKNALIAALAEEKKHRDKAVFYHAVDPLTSFLYDLLTTFRSKLKALTPEQHILFRGMDTPFVTIQDVAAFVQKFDVAGAGDNYSVVDNLTYQDLGLSVNPFLFGSDGIPSSCTYYMFYTMHSVKPVNLENFVNSFMSLTGIPGKFKDYKALYQQYYEHGERKNAKLFQIFIDPQVVDTIVYTSGSMGRLATLKMDDGSHYHGFANILNEVRNFPQEFNDRIKEDRAIDRIDQDNSKLNRLQGRIFMKPEVFHNSKYVTIKSYWHHKLNPELEKSYQQKLGAQVSQDISRWLQNHGSSGKEVFSEGTSPLKTIYQSIFKDRTGINYKEEDVSLAEALSEGDLESLERIFAKDPKIDLNTITFSDLDYHSAYKGTLSLVDLLPSTSKNISGIFDFLIEKGWRPDIFKGKYGQSIIYSIVEKNDPEMLRALLSNKRIDWSDQALFKSNYGGNSILSDAVRTENPEIVKILLESDKIDWTDPDYLRGGHRQSVLFQAVEQKNVEIVKLLLEFGKFKWFDTTLLKDILGNSILFAAVETNDVAIVKLLLESPKINWSDPSLLKDHNYKGISILYKPVEMNNLEMLNTLLSFKEINWNNDSLSNGKNRIPILFEAVSRNEVEIVKAFLKSDKFDWSDPKLLRDEDGESILSFIVTMNDLEMLRNLLSCNKIDWTDPSLLKDRNDTTILVGIARNNNINMLNTLLSFDKLDWTDPSLLKDGNGSVLRFFMGKNNLEMLLTLLSFDKFDWTDRDLLKFNFTDPDIDVFRRGISLLVRAAEMNNTGLVKVLLSFDKFNWSDFSLLKNEYGESVLFIAAQHNNTEMFRDLLLDKQINWMDPKYGVFGEDSSGRVSILIDIKEPNADEKKKLLEEYYELTKKKIDVCKNIILDIMEKYKNLEEANLGAFLEFIKTNIVEKNLKSIDNYPSDLSLQKIMKEAADDLKQVLDEVDVKLTYNPYEAYMNYFQRT